VLSFIEIRPFIHSFINIRWSSEKYHATWNTCKRTGNWWTAVSRWVSLSQKSAFGDLALTLIFGLWHCKPFSNSRFPLTWCSFMTSFTEIPPLSTESRAKLFWPRYDLNLWSLTLKTFPAVATYMLNISAKCRWNSSRKYGDIASGEIVPDGRTDGQPAHMLFACYWWRRNKTEVIPDWFQGLSDYLTFLFCAAGFLLLLADSIMYSGCPAAPAVRCSS